MAAMRTPPAARDRRIPPLPLPASSSSRCLPAVSSQQPAASSSRSTAQMSRAGRLLLRCATVCALSSAVPIHVPVDPANPAALEGLRVKGWIQGLPTTAPAAGYVMPLTMDGALMGWICNLDAPTVPLRLDFTVGGKPVGGVLASGLFFNDRPVIPGAPALLHLSWIFHLPDSALAAATNSTLVMTAVDTASGRSAVFAPGAAAAAGNLSIALRPLPSLSHPALGSACLGLARCPSPGGAFSFGYPWFDVPQGWAELGPNLFETWNCSAQAGGVDTIVQLSILPFAHRNGKPPGPLTPGDRYHHRGFKKDSVHLAETERSADGGPVLHFSAARTGVPGAPDRLLGEGGKVASNWGLKKAMFNKSLGRWEIFDQLDSPTNGYGVSSYDGVDGFASTQAIPTRFDKFWYISDRLPVFSEHDHERCGRQRMGPDYNAQPG